MNLLGQLLAIAIGWCLLMGAFTPGQFLLGTVLGLLVLVLTRQVTGAGRVLEQMWAVVHLVVVVSKDLVISSLRVAWDVCTPTPLARPRIIAIPVADLDPVELTVLANAITLTPGTLSLDVAPDGSLLYVHAMYAADAERERRSIRVDLAGRVRRACGRRLAEDDA